MGLLSNLIYLLFEQPVPLVIAGEEADTTDKDDVDRVDAITQSLPSSDIGLSASKSQGTLKSVSSVSVSYLLCTQFKPLALPRACKHACQF